MNDQLKELVAIGASVACNCQPCFSYHIAKARELGASEEDIETAVEVATFVQKVTVTEMKKYARQVRKEKPTAERTSRAAPPYPACSLVSKG